MTFIPDETKEVQDVPYFDNCTSKDGWEGFATGKSIEKLKREVEMALSRLGASVTNFQRGTYYIGDKKREGFQIRYVVEGLDKSPHPGCLDIAALPVKDHWRVQKTLKKRREQSLKMSLYMTRIGLNGTWFLGKLSPGYAPLMPWMLAGDTGKTVTQLWSESSTFGHLLPSGETEFVEGEVAEL